MKTMTLITLSLEKTMALFTTYLQKPYIRKMSLKKIQIQDAPRNHRMLWSSGVLHAF